MKRETLRRGVFWTVFVVSLFSAGGLFAHPQKPHRVAVVVPNGLDPYFHEKWYGSVEEGKKLGIEVIMYDAGGYQALTKQQGQVEEIIAGGFDGMVITPVSSKGMISVVERAIEAGIRVVVDDIELFSPKVKARVMRDHFTIGFMIAQELAREIEYEGKVIMLPGPSGIEMARSGVSGFEALISSYPKVQIVAKEFTPNNAATAAQVAGDLLGRHRDVKGIYLWDDRVAQGALQALKQAGYQPGEVKIVTQGLRGGVEEEISEEWVQAAIVAEHIGMARVALEAVHDMIHGKEVPRLQYVKNFVVRLENLDKIDRSGFEAPRAWMEGVGKAGKGVR